MKTVLIEARDIPDAWFQAVYQILKKSNKYMVEQGSYVGETRLEFPFVVFEIAYPYHEPWTSMLPEIPPHLKIPPPVDPDYIFEYVPYVMSDNIADNESYTYGQRISGFHVPTEIVKGQITTRENYFSDLPLLPWWNNSDEFSEGHNGTLWYRPSEGSRWTPNKLSQIYRFIDLLRQTPNTNQAILQIAHPMDCLLKDPPCLRHIDMRIENNCLVFYPYFRSWDLWGGLPANLAGIAVLQKYMADEIGVDIGPMIASSKGLHIYGYAEELAKIRILSI